MRSTESILAEWCHKPAPLLPLLHAFHKRDGRITEEAIDALAEALRMPKADLYGTVTFYHHLSLNDGHREELRICTGPICAHKGAHDILEQLAPEGAQAMACSGRCDMDIPALRGDETLAWQDGTFVPAPRTPLPATNPGGLRECVFAHIREPGRHTLKGYRATGGYEALGKVLRDNDPGALAQLIESSGLRGRGGAGFPTGAKWRAVHEAPGDVKYVVCNADEGEPGCFKDRAIMDHDPHAVLEGMMLAAHAAGARVGFIYLRYEYPETLCRLEEALREAREAGLLGENIFGRGFSFDIHIRRGAGAYVCGEETSLLNSLEGQHPFPRNRPPFPVTHGFEERPTVVNNVETLASTPWIVLHGAEAYQALGLGEHAGTKLISLSGDIRRPGNYEVPLGFSLATLIEEWAGGMSRGLPLQAVTMAGLSGGFLGAEQVRSLTLDEPSIRAHGSFLGAGGIMVFDSGRNMKEVAASAMHFFADESCGKCFPCRIGTKRLHERLSGEAGPADDSQWLQELQDIGRVMRSSSACGLGQAAPLITDSMMRFFPDALARESEGGENA